MGGCWLPGSSRPLFDPEAVVARLARVDAFDADLSAAARARPADSPDLDRALTASCWAGVARAISPRSGARSPRSGALPLSRPTSPPSPRAGPPYQTMTPWSTCLAGR